MSQLALFGRPAKPQRQPSPYPAELHKAFQRWWLGGGGSQGKAALSVSRGQGDPGPDIAEANGWRWVPGDDGQHRLQPAKTGATTGDDR